jgi:hypothetical protein
MCCVIESNAVLSNTTIYAARVRHPDGERVHVLGYQNSVSLTSAAPNAMILPVPTADLLGPENLVDARPFSGILNSYRRAVVDMKPRTRSFSETKGGDMLGVAAGSHRVFQSGSYTVASATSAAGLAMAVKEVPAAVRPTIPYPFLASLSRMYPGWSFIACCFSGEDFEDRALDPVILWYRPLPGREEKLFAPAIDAHDGNPPDLSAFVGRDHTLAFGDSDAESFRNAPNMEYAIGKVPVDHRWMFTKAIVGSVLGDARTTHNGDFVMPASMVMDSRVPGYIGADQIRIEIPSV